uniref:Pectinesterase n=1 Tax=Taenia asiatica TaxID=60517 RepID=A0A158R9Q7_TAEAS
LSNSNRVSGDFNALEEVTRQNRFARRACELPTVGGAWYRRAIGSFCYYTTESSLLWIFTWDLFYHRQFFFNWFAEWSHEEVTAIVLLRATHLPANHASPKQTLTFGQGLHTTEPKLVSQRTNGFGNCSHGNPTTLGISQLPCEKKVTLVGDTSSFAGQSNILSAFKGNSATFAETMDDRDQRWQFYYFFAVI